MITADEIRFDVKKEPRASIEDSRELICIDVDQVGAGYRAIINGQEYSLPDSISNMRDARRLAVTIAVRELNVAIGELLMLLV